MAPIPMASLRAAPFRFLQWPVFIALLLALAGTFWAPAAQAKRLALVIGNSDYMDPMPKLPNPARDADAIAKALRDVGFDVTLRMNLRQADAPKVLGDFYARIAVNDEVLFYYAGHGTQYDGENFLPPVDLPMVDKGPIIRSSIRLNDVLQGIGDRKPAITLIFLDACRDAPASSSRNLKVEAGRGSVSDTGLAEVKTQTGGTLIQYATAPGETASDGAPGDRNGLYTKHLLRHIKDPSPIDRMLKDVNFGVREESTRLGKVQAPWKHDSLPEDFWFNREAQRVAGARSATGPGAVVFRTEPGTEFSPCDRCPKMKVIPGMEAPDGGQIRMALSITEVTFDEWDACKAAKGCGPATADDEGLGRGRRPVANVSLEDVAAYLLWLNEKTGRQYRLPTEAEWEFAARGGKPTPYPWGASAAGGAFANCKGCGAPLDAEGRATMEVASFRANGYGLFDVIGNAEEWIDACGTRAGCTAARVRGGSFKTQGRDATTSYGRNVSPGATSPAIGFRVALTL